MLTQPRKTPLKRSSFFARPTNGTSLLSSSQWRSQTAVQKVISPTGSGELVSARNLDLCLLAVCSCVLSLMCHIPGGAVNVSSTPSTGMAATTGSPVQVDFLVKAGLLTSNRQEFEVQDDQ